LLVPSIKDGAWITVTAGAAVFSCAMENNERTAIAAKILRVFSKGSSSRLERSNTNTAVVATAQALQQM
jgi:hypothetical protein